MPANSFVLFTLGPVQGFIKAARSVRDLWSGSYLLSYLTFRAMKAVADQSGLDAKAIVFPDVETLPLWRWEVDGRPKPAPLSVLEPCIPNRFLAQVPDNKNPQKLAEAAEAACRAAWGDIAEGVRAFLHQATSDVSLLGGKNGLWHQQIDTFFEVYTAVLPQDKYTPELAAKLLGKATANEWADRHQVAQKLLAAVKNKRHFPVYSPTFPGDTVPQKDTLLGTLEHVGPGNRREAGDFWAKAATAWLDRGSKVTRREKLCGVSLVKRFAWAHAFSKAFGLNPRELRYNDSATIAAAKWLANDRSADPRSLLKKGELWSGQWLHWPTTDPPNDDLDEDPMPDSVWRAIQEKKAAQGKPPTYYAVFVFDGDKMGDRFNAAKGADDYRKISGTLGNFALKVIGKFVEKHRGELIYAGGDDALCMLPTETALACAAEINTAFRDNWKANFPSEEPATISGGLVVAHYKEDLRFVMDQARAAEKKAKDAGRNALRVTVCRRSGEHTSALVPWDFLPKVTAWVDGFLAKASDRWAYKLRGDLPVLASDRKMFELELGRQLGRAEDITRKHFPADRVKAEFAAYTGSIEDFVTLLQSASFLARGRDA